MFDTCEQALGILAKRMDARAEQIKKDRDYANGRPPLPEMGQNLRESWVAFQKKAISDLGGLANGSLANRMIPQDIQIGSEDGNPLVEQARRIWRDNRCDIAVADAIRDYLDTRWGYLVVGIDNETGEAVITREKPEQFIAATDPLRPWRVRAALKVWRDDDAKRDYARVWIKGQAQTFSREAQTLGLSWIQTVVGNGWAPVSEPEEFEGRPTIVVLERPEPFLSAHYNLIDRIMLGKLNRLVTTAMQAFRQRATKGGLPEFDDNGNAINWNKVFEPAPGALWDLPENIDIWESQTTDIRPMLDAEKADAREFASTTGTPLSDILPDAANQTAEGVVAAKEKQIFQAGKEILRLSPSLAVLIVYALRAEGANVDDRTVEMLWVPPQHVSMAERYSAAAQAKGAGLPLRYIMRTILGMSAEQIAQAEQDIATEQLQAILNQPAPAAVAA